MAEAAGSADGEQQEQQQQQQHETSAAAAAAAGDDIAAPSPSAAGSGKQQDGTGLLLPLARVKKMMKETGDVKMIAADANFAVARAAELFLEELAQRSLAVMQADSSTRKAVDYKDVAAVVDSWAAVDFLRCVVPQKVKLADVIEEVRKTQEELRPRCLNDD